MNPGHDLEEAVLRRVRPTALQTRKAKAAARELGAALRADAKEAGHRIRPVVVGSLAKGTHMRPLEVDLFLLFRPDVSRAALEDVGLKIAGARLRNREHRFAEHPYARGQFRGLAFDVVPAYDVESGSSRLSAVDRTPFHARYVKEGLAPKQADQVRLLKAWLKGIGSYGAETAVGGVSGYLAELLVLRFGDFAGVVSAAATWQVPVRVLMQGRRTSLAGPFVLADPVDASRNAAAAVTPQQIQRFQRAARDYLDRPSMRFFFPKLRRTPSPGRVRTLLGERGVVAMAGPLPSTRAQAQQPHLARITAKAERALERAGFQVRGTNVQAGATAFAWAAWVDPRRLAPTTWHRGPRITDKEHAQRFRERWVEAKGAGPIVEKESRLWVEVRVTARSPAAALLQARADVVAGTKWSPGQLRRVRIREARAALASPLVRRTVEALLNPQDPWNPSKADVNIPK